MKGTLIGGFDSYETLFNRYSRMQDTLVLEDFKRVIEELKLQEYHSEEQVRDFFTFIQGGNNMISGSTFARLTLTQIVNSIKRLAPKNILLLIQTILEKLLAETKKNNLSFQTVKTIFSDYDLMKTGFVTYQDFCLAFDVKL